jgi:hypothetical protein
MAEESSTLWIWGCVEVVCFSFFIASLKSDYFKVLHYIVDHAGVRIQYEIAPGPLETSKIVQRRQPWSTVKSAGYLPHSERAGLEIRGGVLLTLNSPIESGRCNIELISDRPEQLMALVDLHLSHSHAPKRSAASILAIA